MLTFSEFLTWERSTTDTIDFKKVYADMAGDTLAGLVLSQLVYWHMPSKAGGSKMRVNKQGKQWVAARRYDWWESTRMSPRQVDRVIKLLCDKGLIEKKVWMFDGLRTLHLRIEEKRFMELWEEITQNPPVNPYLEDEKPTKTTKLPNGELSTPNYQTVKSKLPNGEIEITNPLNPLTKTTAETTTKKKDLPPVAETKVPQEKLSGDEYEAFMGVLQTQLKLPIGVARQVYHQLRGTVKDKKSKRYLHGEMFREKPATLAELKAYVPFYRTKVTDPTISIPISAEGLETWFNRLRSEMQPKTKTVLTLAEGERGFITDSASEGVIRYEKDSA